MAFVVESTTDLCEAPKVLTTFVTTVRGLVFTSNNVQVRLERPWRWRESNPRPSASRLAFSERSRQGIFETLAVVSAGDSP